MPQIPLDEGVSIHCIVDDFLWPWDTTTPVLMTHGFARNELFWNRWVPVIAETHRVYRPDLLGCGVSDPPLAGYRYTPEAIGAQIIAVLDALSLNRVHWRRDQFGEGPLSTRLSRLGPHGAMSAATWQEDQFPTPAPSDR